MKRLILTATDKGGVGKSFYNVQLVQWHKDAGRGVVAVDPDYTNPSLMRFHRDARFVDIQGSGGEEAMDGIILAFDDQPLVIVDGVAGHKGVFLEWIREVRLFEDIAPNEGIDITFCLVIDEDKDTVSQAAEIIREVWKRVDWVIVKNQRTTAHTRIWDESLIRRELEEMCGGQIREIVMPKLHEHLIEPLHKANASLSAAINDRERFNIMDRNRLRTYRDHLYAEFERYSDVLSVPASAYRRSAA